MTSLVSFSTAKTEKKWGKILVVSFDVTNKTNLVNVFFQMSLEFKPRLLLSALCYSKISTICHFQDSEKKAFKDLKTISSLASSI